jgi:hypothetical protein
MSFLTSEEATGLGQPWYGESNVVAGMGGLLSMQELTSLKNYYDDPPDFPASGMGTLVDSTERSHGRGRGRGRGRGGRRRGWKRGAKKLCPNELAAARKARRGLKDCMKQAGIVASDASPEKRTSEGAVLSGMGAGQRASLAIGAPLPRADFVPGEIVSGATLVDQAQGFGGLGIPRSYLAPGVLTTPGTLLDQVEYPVPISDLAPGEYSPGISDWVPFQRSPIPSETQGTWLSPSQVPAWDRESAEALVADQQNFSGLGAAAQGSWLAPGQVASHQRGTDESLVDHPQSFSLGGLGKRGRGRGRGRGGDTVLPSELNLSPICDPDTGTCISYATPAEIQSAIGRKFEGRSALVKSRVPLPSFYSHPQLGPWGVDPRQAYQYWWGQQAAMQQAAVTSPLAIWGSPGFVAPTPPLPASPIAQAASFDPYSDAYPTAGAAVERF